MNFNPRWPMKITVFVALGVTAGCLLNGCARDHSKEAVYQPIPPTQRAPANQMTVEAGTNAPLSYQWYLNINTNEGAQQFSVVVSSNAPPTYQWYKNGNTNEGAQH